MAIKAVISDMDGVLIDARDWHYETLNRALALFGYNISRHEHLTSYDGLPTAKKLHMLTAEKGLPQALHRFINEMKQAYTADTVTLMCRPTFNHQYALSMLKTRHGLKLAVASNSIRATVNLMMDKAHLSQYLDLQLSNEDVAQAKPAPDIYLKAMEMLGVAPDETLILEDNPHGIAAAKASGAHVLVIGEPADVTYQNIIARIAEIEGANVKNVVNQ
ncbi:HAD family phosphatase [Pseudomonas aeruginosa]|uniref:HAD family hydrolase n=1 Tax=Pseudomonas aeruginosa TaxID=287 RepID=UPI002B27451D|nr:HAD family phosphatase [Pseudomonas aeruginosa]MEA8593005.1 HAD family phosphatase [Pseudomonas aeruginosa]